MTEQDKGAPEPHGDASADLIHDLASGPPPKGLETVKAASDAMEDDRRDRIARRAHELWEADGGRHGSHEDHWKKAEEEIERES